MTCGNLRNAALGLAVCGLALARRPAAAASDDGPARPAEQRARPRCRSSSAPPATPRPTRCRPRPRAWATSTGNTATVTPAQDIAQQLGQAFAGGTPPDVFYVDAARFADYASVGALEPYGGQDHRPGGLLPEPAHRLHLRRQALLRAEGLLHPGAADQHRPVDEGRADRRRRPDHLGPAHRGGEKLKARGHRPAGHRRHPRPDRRLHGAGRRLDRQPGRQAGHRRQPGEPQAPCSYVQTLLKNGSPVTPSSSTPAGAARRSARARPR